MLCVKNCTADKSETMFLFDVVIVCFGLSLWADGFPAFSAEYKGIGAAERGGSVICCDAGTG